MKKRLYLFALPLLMGILSNCNNSGSKPISIQAKYGDDNVILYGDEIDQNLLSLSLSYSNGHEEEKSLEDFTIDLNNYDPFKREQEIDIQITLKEDSSISTTLKLKKESRKEMKVLFIGNSFSEDTIQWMYEIAESLNINLVAENMNIGGCSLATHLSNLLNDKPAYGWTHREGNSWIRDSGIKLSDILKSREWDFVSIQQVSGLSGVPSSIENIDTISNFIKGYSNGVNIPKVVWNMTWSYQSDSTHADFSRYNNDQLIMYNAIKNTVLDNVLSYSEIKHVIPNGTAIQNARTSYIGDHLTRDGFHLSYDLGRFIAGLTAVTSLTGSNPLDCTFSSENKNNDEVAKESVLNALNNPFEITESMYKDN